MNWPFKGFGNMARNLLIVEFKEEAEYFLRNHPDIIRGAKVLSLLPEASEVLIKEGIPFETSIAYLPRR